MAKVGRLVIDPGHGGSRPGVVLKDNGGKVVIREADAALHTALTLKWVLLNELEVPFDVVLTRNEDVWVPFHRRTNTYGDLFVAVHYDIPHGGKPIYYQARGDVSKCVAGFVNALSGNEHPLWSTRRAAHVGGRLYIDDVHYPAILVEVDTIDNYKDNREYRLAKVRPLAKALKEVMNALLA